MNHRRDVFILLTAVFRGFGGLWGWLAARYVNLWFFTAIPFIIFPLLNPLAFHTPIFPSANDCRSHADRACREHRRDGEIARVPC